MSVPLLTTATTTITCITIATSVLKKSTNLQLKPRHWGLQTRHWPAPEGPAPASISPQPSEAGFGSRSTTCSGKVLLSSSSHLWPGGGGLNTAHQNHVINVDTPVHRSLAVHAVRKRQRPTAAGPMPTMLCEKGIFRILVFAVCVGFSLRTVRRQPCFMNFGTDSTRSPTFSRKTTPLLGCR